MKRLLMTSLLAGPALLGVLATAVPARALVIAMPAPPGPVRVAQADAILVGRVMAIEDKDIEADIHPGNPDKQKLRVAVVAVGEDIAGVKKGTRVVRVAFNPPPMLDPNNPIRPGIGRPRPGFGGPELSTGQEGLFYLTRHFKDDLYLVTQPYTFTMKDNNPGFAKELEEAKAGAKVLANPVESLKAGDAQNRLLAAAILITKYRTPRPSAQPAKTEAVGAEESKLILKAILDGDWAQRPVRPGLVQPINSMNLFQQLGVSERDGFMPPQRITRPQDYSNAARDWLQKHLDTYRVQRFVAGQ